MFLFQVKEVAPRTSTQLDKSFFQNDIKVGLSGLLVVFVGLCVCVCVSVCVCVFHFKVLQQLLLKFQCKLDLNCTYSLSIFVLRILKWSDYKFLIWIALTLNLAIINVKETSMQSVMI